MAPLRPAAAATSTTAAAAPFPYELDCSTETIARREQQIADAQAQMRSLHAEVDEMAMKFFQLSQLALQPNFAHLQMAQRITEALEGASSGFYLGSSS
jgi:hypothetical protein